MTSKKQPDISWDISISLINNPFIFRASIQLCLITWIVAMLLFGFIFAATGEFDVLLPMLTIMTMIIAGLWVSMLLVMIIFFGNRMPMRFTINKGGATCDVTSKRSKAANRLLTVLGILARKPGAVGTGVIALSQESQTFEWERVYAVKYNEKRKVITLRNRWRSLMMIFCLPENYSDVAEIIKEKILQQPKNQHPNKNPLFSLFSRTALTILSCIPLFRLDYPFKVDPFIPIFILCFSMATIWLIPLFGYVVIAVVLHVAIVIISQGLQVHSSQYGSLGNYQGFELINGDEWIFMALIFLAIIYLIWSSWRAVKGKDESALFMD
jgi:hypothetical protein